MAEPSADPRPRVLFVTSAAFNRTTGGGITFSNLFRSWPADRLATVHDDPVPVTSEVCRHFYRLSAREIGRWPGLGRWLSLEANGGAAGEAAPTSKAHSSVARQIKRALIGNAWPDSGRLSLELERWIAAFRPELIYAAFGTIGMMELVEAIRRRFGLKLVVHFMDDWPSYLYRGGLLSALPNARMRALVRRLVATAAARLAIGGDMAGAYAARYGVPFQAFQNAVDMGIRAGTPPSSRPVGDPARVLYVGSIFDNAQAQSLIDVAHAVAALVRGGRRLRFDIHSPAFLAERFRARLEVAPCVRLHDTIADDEEFFGAIGAADILVLPVNFDAESVRLVRFSMPTKLPAYLVSGTPVLAYGPEATAQIAYAKREGWAHVVGEPGRAAEGIVRLLDGAGLRMSLVARARAVALANHDASVVRRRFQEALIAAVREPADT
ncbi:MAG: hypothetical protein ACT4P2_05770 [Pseudomonadota bacterium]